MFADSAAQGETHSFRRMSVGEEQASERQEDDWVRIAASCGIGHPLSASSKNYVASFTFQLSLVQ